ncbi:hypothetical protein JQ580_24960 [Bradyrhizobium japonicum]|uniref:hypothetical protein n=1 Tax=Bradyrhizobium japonicum TaxID=375 RepID=UPI001BA611D4|nr:hypothetical protein [Bradyrhizobium japonicum]MBR0993975.1 hypothetical protein [Bradyrhizobium japonicum]
MQQFNNHKITMTQTASKDKHSNDNFRSISPVQELRFLDAMMADSELPMTARVVGYQLVRWTCGDKSHRFSGYAWARRDTLADCIGRDSETTITTATNALKARGWIIVKRRPNTSSLIRPNWDRMAQQQEKPEDQKIVFPEDQKTVHPEDQKTGPYSADHYSADLDSALIPGRSAPGMRASVEGDSAYGADRSDFRQTSEEAKQTLEEIKQAWPAPSKDAEYQPRHDSDKGASVHYYRLLKSGVPAHRIKQAALRFLKSKEEDQHWSRSFASFLTGHLHDYLDPDQPDLYIPPDGELLATNDNRPPVERKASGIDWENDPPF